MNAFVRLLLLSSLFTLLSSGAGAAQERHSETRSAAGIFAAQTKPDFRLTPTVEGAFQSRLSEDQDVAGRVSDESRLAGVGAASIDAFLRWAVAVAAGERRVNGRRAPAPRPWWRRLFGGEG